MYIHGSHDPCVSYVLLNLQAAGAGCHMRSVEISRNVPVFYVLYILRVVIGVLHGNINCDH